MSTVSRLVIGLALKGNQLPVACGADFIRVGMLIVKRQAELSVLEVPVSLCSTACLDLDLV